MHNEMLHKACLLIHEISIATTTAKLSANIVHRARVLVQSLLVNKTFITGTAMDLSAPRMPDRLKIVIKATLLFESSVALCASVFHDGERGSECCERERKLQKGVGMYNTISRMPTKGIVIK